MNVATTIDRTQRDYSDAVKKALGRPASTGPRAGGA